MNHLTLELNARLMPLDRGDWYEDPISEALEEAGCGTVEGGGTFMADNGEISSVDIEIAVPNMEEKTIQTLLEVLGRFPMPKGSRLYGERYEDGKEVPFEHPFGTMEGLSLAMNGTELPDEVYKQYDINVAISELQKRLEGIGDYYSYRQGPENTMLYFYGTSFEEMKERMMPFIDEYPLCQKSEITQIA